MNVDANLRDPDVYVTRQLRRWKADPLAMVRELFKVEPDPWQAEALAAFPHVKRLGFKACKGPGKTAVLSWLAWNFLLTRPFPKIGATSISEDNIDDNLWPEMAKWQALCPLLAQQFQWSKTRIVYKDAPASWFMTLRTWPKTADPQGVAPTDQADDDAEAAQGRGNGQTAKPQAVLAKAPAGYREWLDDLSAVADEGTTALQAAWKASKAEYRAYLTATNTAQWDTLKARAAKVKGASVSA